MTHTWNTFAVLHNMYTCSLNESSFDLNFSVQFFFSFVFIRMYDIARWCWVLGVCVQLKWHTHQVSCGSLIFCCGPKIKKTRSDVCDYDLITQRPHNHNVRRTHTRRHRVERPQMSLPTVELCYFDLSKIHLHFVSDLPHLPHTDEFIHHRDII